MFALRGFRLRTARVWHDPFAIDQLVDVVLTSSLQVLQGSIELLLVRRVCLHLVHGKCLGIVGEESRQPSKFHLTPLWLLR